MQTLEGIEKLFPKEYSEAQLSRAKTLFFKLLALEAHQFYTGKMQTVPKAPIYGFNWFNVWYTPGVSNVSTTIREENNASFCLSNRSNLVAVVSDSTRVLGDGDCTPPGGLGVMEGKSMLMKYLGGVDAVALCIDSRDANGVHQPEKIIDFVRMVQPSFGAINLEDISQPNCYKVLDELRNSCDIPVWHDDAQGTACVTLAGLTNALKLADKKLSEVKVVLYGAGASNSTIATLLIADGCQPKNIIMFDKDGGIHVNRSDIEKDSRFYKIWNLAQQTNPQCINAEEEAFEGADVLIAYSQPGPDTIKTEWIKKMSPKAIVFTCANPVPEIYPYQAKKAGAFIAATGRGDFPNQVNNSICFPSILKGTLMVAASKISDTMALTAAHSIARYAEEKIGIHSENILPNMMDDDLFPNVAADVAMQAIKEGIARQNFSRHDLYLKAKQDIMESHQILNLLQEKELIKPFPDKIIKEVIARTIAEIS